MSSRLAAAARILLIAPAFIALAIKPVTAQTGRIADTSSIIESRESDRRLLLDVTLNGLQAGVLPFVESKGRILIPAQTARALRIRSNVNGLFNPSTVTSIDYELNRQLGTISFDVPASQMLTLTLEPDLMPAKIRLSPETTGLFVNYDLAVRKNSGSSDPSTTYGGLAVVQAFRPDFAASSGWSYQSARPGASAAPVRLDSLLTWRPAVQSLAVRLGDVVSAAGATARPFRFFGISAGTDHSAEPGWTSQPIASIAGTAQPSSSIDLYVNGIMRDRMATAGGPFKLVLPPGNYADTTRVVVTDITGGIVEIPLDPPRFNLDLVKEQTLLWSAGVGLPRFSWGSRSNDYLAATYGYGNLRYGINNQVTLEKHLEAGPGLLELGAEIKATVTSGFGLSGSIAHSWTGLGTGSFVNAGAVIAMSDDLFFSADYDRSLGDFHDAVSWSARAYDLEHRSAVSRFDLPRRSSFDGQVSWRVSDLLTLSSSYRRVKFQDSSAVSFGSVTANVNIARGATAYLSATNSYDNVQGSRLGISIGLSFSFSPGLNGSISATRQDSEQFRQVQLTRPLGQDRGSFGWELSKNRSASDTYTNGEASVRTGRGIPAIGYTRFGGQSQSYLKMKGAVGIVAGHAFTSDPVQGGIIVADVGQPNVPVLLNGYLATRSRSDGSATLAVDVAGTPQSVEIDDSNLPLSQIASHTRQIVTIREGSGSIAYFGVQSSETGATILVTVNGNPPRAGTEVLTADGRIPVDRQGRAWIPALERDEVVVVELPNRQQCSLNTNFDGQGGPGRRIGPLDCKVSQ